jgi:hypothetical protein
MHTAAQAKRDAARRRHVREAASEAISDATRDRRGRPRRALRRQLKRGPGWGSDAAIDPTEEPFAD